MGNQHVVLKSLLQSLLRNITVSMIVNIISIIVSSISILISTISILRIRSTLSIPSLLESLLRAT